MYLRALVEQIEQIDPSLMSLKIDEVQLEEVQPGEKVVGTLPEDLQKFYCFLLDRELESDLFYRQAAHEALDLILGVPMSGNAHYNFPEFCGEVKKVEVTCALRKIFWVSVRDHFEVYDKPLSLRRDLQVVTPSEEDEERAESEEENAVHEKQPTSNV